MSRFKRIQLLCIPVALTAIMLGLGTGCSHKPADNAGSPNADAIVPPPDAGTDAVPQAAVEDRSGVPDANAAPDTNAPAPIVEASDVPPSAPQPDRAAPAEVATAPVPPAPAENQVPAGMNSTGSAEPAPASVPPAQSRLSADGTYTVKAGDTLMKIAFENYGDLYKWKEIYQANKDKISNPNAVPPGTQLKLDSSAGPVSIARNGSPYMIKSGDTLGAISTDVYGTKKKWKRLWENNKQLIQDPNKIYAGFYLFYTLTPQEREDFIRRKGAEPPAEETSPAPLAEQAEPSRKVSSVSKPAPVAPPPAPAEEAAPPAPQPENNSAQAAPPALPGDAGTPPPPADPSRNPASVQAPKVDLQQLNSMNNEPAPPPPAMRAVPPPAEHSADLNEVIQQAQKDEAAASTPVAAGP